MLIVQLSKHGEDRLLGDLPLWKLPDILISHHSIIGGMPRPFCDSATASKAREVPFACLSLKIFLKFSTLSWKAYKRCPMPLNDQQAWRRSSRWVCPGEFCFGGSGVWPLLPAPSEVADAPPHTNTTQKRRAEQLVHAAPNSLFTMGGQHKHMPMPANMAAKQQ